MKVVDIGYTSGWFEHNADDFNLWFDSDTFNWFMGSWLLARCCSKDFDIWWDSDKYYWKDESGYLIDFCWEYRDIWFDGWRGRHYLSGYLLGLFEHRRGDHSYLPIVKVKA